jgi:hypothetical protein
MYTSTSIIALAALLASTVTSAPTYPGAYPTNTTAPVTEPTTAADPPASGLTLFQQLVLAPNAVERSKLLADDQFIFQFNDPNLKEGVTKGEGGNITRADHATFPALVGQGGAVAIGFLGPCGFNTPHVHPRAAELNLVIEGNLFANVVFENGARFIEHTIGKFGMTVFPQGAVHTEFNPDCTPSTFVASFPNEDPGVGQIAQEYFGLTSEIVKGSAGGEVTIGGEFIDAFRDKLPANVAKGVDSCLQKCGIAKK